MQHRYQYITITHKDTRTRVRVVKEREYQGITLAVYRIHRNKKFYTVRKDTGEHYLQCGAHSISAALNNTIDRIKLTTP